MKKEKKQTIYVYTKGTTRFAYLNPLSVLEMAMNGMKIADVIQVENGIEWFNEVNQQAEALINLMGRRDRNEAIEWVTYLFDGMKVGENFEEKETCWFMEDVKRLSNKKQLTEEEKKELEYALMVLEINVDNYGFDVKSQQYI